MSRSDIVALAVALGLAALLLCPATGFAQQMPQGGPPQAGGGPGGGPGGPGQGRPQEARLPKIKLEDIEKVSREMFATADLDRDGTVTLDELQTIMDRHRDAVIAERFAQLDSDGDRVVDYTEFATWQLSLGARAAEEGGSRALDMARLPDAVGIPPGRDDKARFVAMLLTPISRASVIEANVNYDGGADLAEFLAFQRRKFDAADEDANGVLEGPELRRLMEARHPKRGCVVASLPPPSGNDERSGPALPDQDPDCGAQPR